MKTFFENILYISEELRRVETTEDMEEKNRKARRLALQGYLIQAVQEEKDRPGAVQRLDVEAEYQHVFQPGGRWEQMTQTGTGAYRFFEKDGEVLIQTDGVLGFVRALEALGAEPEPEDPDCPF